eukprot:m.445846 g.445846  ORF g.445846 m.445846 type:complete len:165 (+) comp19284_c0_seq1:129-623(+)
MAHLTKDKSVKARWTCVYPTYIDANKTLAQGRRVPKVVAVEVPHPAFMADVLQTNGFTYEYEQKLFPRDAIGYGFPGRFRVQLFDSDDKPLKPEAASKMALLKFIAAAIPNSEKFKEWKIASEAEKAKQAEKAELEERAAAEKQRQQAAAAKPTSSKKKTKKKK